MPIPYSKVLRNSAVSPEENIVSKFQSCLLWNYKHSWKDISKQLLSPGQAKIWQTYEGIVSKHLYFIFSEK